MDVSSAIYDKINKPQLEGARALIALILADHPQRKFDIILDVGCGSGNVTKILSDAIPHKNVIAFDIDSNMISQADINNTDKSTAFIIEDISKSWDNLDNKLRTLEGSVDLIFSNFVLHWVDDRDLAAHNMLRLLKPDGLLYFNIGIIKPICDFVSSETKAEIEKHMKIDRPEVQMSNWAQSLEKLGFQNIETELMNYEWKFDTSEQFKSMLVLFRNCYYKQIPQFLEMEEPHRTDLVSKIEELLFKTLSVKSGTAPSDNFDVEKRTIFFDGFRIKANAVKTTHSNLSKVSSGSQSCSIL